MKILSVIPNEDYILLVKFDNQQTKNYDVSKLFSLDTFKPLQDKFLFKQVIVDITGYGVIWNDEIDISEYELWTNGFN